MRFKNDQWYQDNPENGLLSNYIWTLFQSSDGTIWAGDRTNGVMSYKDKRWIKYDYEDGIPLGVVSSIVEDDQNNIWIGLENVGIYQFKPDPNPPAIKIVSAPDRLVPDARGVFSFQGYDAWNVTQRDKLVYSWRIQNQETNQIVRDWNKFSLETSALLPPLKPGRYRFEVVTQDKHRNTSVNPAQAVFVVNPYFWQTYHFRIPVVLSVIFALFSLWLWKKRLEHEMQKEIVSADMRIQQEIGMELHDTTKADLIGISYTCQNLALKLEESQFIEKDEMNNLIDIVNQASQNIDKVSKGLSTLHLEEIGFQTALENLLDTIENRYPIQCSFSSVASLNIENEEARMHLFYIAREAVNNAVKHSHAKQIIMNIREENHLFVLSIQDDGVGIPKVIHPNGRGIEIMKYRAELIHADLHIGNSGEGGTLVECKVPIQ